MSFEEQERERRKTKESDVFAAAGDLIFVTMTFPSDGNQAQP